MQTHANVKIASKIVHIALKRHHKSTCYLNCYYACHILLKDNIDLLSELPCFIIQFISAWYHHTWYVTTFSSFKVAIRSLALLIDSSLFSTKITVHFGSRYATNIPTWPCQENTYYTYKFMTIFILLYWRNYQKGKIVVTLNDLVLHK